MSFLEIMKKCQFSLNTSCSKISLFNNCYTIIIKLFGGLLFWGGLDSIISGGLTVLFILVIYRQMSNFLLIYINHYICMLI